MEAHPDLWYEDEKKWGTFCTGTPAHILGNLVLEEES